MNLGSVGAGEGPAWDGKGNLYFTNENRITRRDSAGKLHIFREPSGEANGLLFDAEHRLLICESGTRRITRAEVDGKTTVLADRYEGMKFNSPNDITIDSKGRIYFSDPRYLGWETIDQPVMGVYRIDTDGSISRIITDGGKPNGVAISPDQKTFYLVSNDNGATGFERLSKGGATQADKVSTPLHKGRMALMAYDLAADGTAKFRKVLKDYSPEDGPDGCVCDRDGNVYAAVRAESRPGICVYSPEGKELAYIKTEVPTNVGFGRGKEAKTLYITAGKGLYRIKLNREGYQLPGKK